MIISPIELLLFANILILIAHSDCEKEQKFRLYFRKKEKIFILGGGLHIFKGPPKSKKIKNH